MFGRTRHRSFALSDVEEGHHRVTYRGVPAIKNPFDYTLYQMLISSVRPDLLVEIGTNKGGSALYLADLLELNGKGELHTIDLPENREDGQVQQHPRIRVFRNGFHEYDTALLAAFENILVIDDGSHQYSDCMTALDKFSPFVSQGSYFIVEDGIISDLGREKEFDGGPRRAIREFLATHPEFETDRSYCDFFGRNATFNVDGYLKRTRGGNQ